MNYIKLKRKEQIPVVINGQCSYQGKGGKIVQVEGVQKVSDDTLTVVKLSDGKEVKLRVLCFYNKAEAKELLKEILK